MVDKNRLKFQAVGRLFLSRHQFPEERHGHHLQMKSKVVVNVLVQIKIKKRDSTY